MIKTTILESDYSDYGGEVVRWEDPSENYPDCSCGCVWYDKLNHNYGYCKNPAAPRFNLLTFEHQAGYECFVPETKNTMEFNNE